MNSDILFFFGEHMDALPLYERLEDQILTQIPEVKIKVAKTQITFANKPVGKDDAATVEMLDKQIELYEKLEKIVEKADDKSIGELSRKIKDVTQSMKPGKEMPILTNDLSLMIKEADAVK